MLVVRRRGGERKDRRETCMDIYMKKIRDIITSVEGEHLMMNEINSSIITKSLDDRINITMHVYSWALR